MVFASTLALVRHASRHRYAVGHFNVNNLETVQGIVGAAVKRKSPVILATSEGGIRYAGMHYLQCLAATAAEEASVQVALHLDHGRDMGIIRHAIRHGYSSVMVDGSAYAFEKNVRLTKQVVQLAHRKHIAVEAELGTIGGAEDTVSSRRIQYTDPDQAKEFVDRTGCDLLAVAIGTSHGAYKFAGHPHLRMDVLKKIRKSVSVPLVLHGASGVYPALVKQAQQYGAQLGGVQGVPDNQIKLAIRLGIAKINTDTDLRLAFDAAVRKVIATQPKDFDPRHILGPARDAIQNIVEQRIRLFGSGGKK